MLEERDMLGREVSVDRGMMGDQLGFTCLL